MTTSYGRKSISNASVSAVLKAPLDDFLTQTPRVEDFENDLCTGYKKKYLTGQTVDQKVG